MRQFQLLTIVLLSTLIVVVYTAQYFGVEMPDGDEFYDMVVP